MNPDPVFKALADETRRAILEGLAGGPEPVHLIAARFAISRPAISKHLKTLSDCRLVRASKAGKETLYALDAAALDQVHAWIDRFWRGRLTALKRLAETDA